ncbi:MAG: serine hydrolase [Lachnospiraceae bacterium]|nr:serine hydrolase [Lachnospiraceae bacterium]
MINKYEYPHIKAIQIIRNKKVVFEQLREDIDENTLFPVGCIFKSFLAILVGIAIYEGKIESIEDCVLDYFLHNDVTDLNWYRLKIKHALSKTTGLIWPGPREPMPKGIKEVMQLKFENEPGILFQYKPDPQIIVYLLEEVYDMEITKLFEEKLLSHFTNRTYQWNRDNIENMRVSVDILNDFGQLMLNKGTVGEKRLFSEDFFEQSVTGYSDGGFPECAPYGLGWWINEIAGVECFYAAGFGGQYLTVLPEKEMVIIILSDMDRPHPENKKIIESVCLGED